ncbi:hypothetical protein [Pseudothauera lacus]|uniref:hypothetical protein n=1 Tax=Pseudothauera lacus TaxID=2136175 RepID=UPI001F1CBA84|nr:hypothetical protein [Pseudothauera lacus]
MAVLAEAISVIVRKDAVNQRLAGGDERFRALLPNRTLCEDDALYRIGFLSPAETQRFTDALQDAGLCFIGDNGEAVDLAVADQQHGPTTACAWLGFGRCDIDGGGHWVSTCWLRGATGDDSAPPPGTPIATPQGWRYETSLSKQFAFTPTTPDHS